MKTARSALSWIITCTIVASIIVALSAVRLEYCGQCEPARPHVETLASRLPTPAPPSKVLLVNIETDKPDLEISWLEK